MYDSQSFRDGYKLAVISCLEIFPGKSLSLFSGAEEQRRNEARPVSPENQLSIHATIQPNSST
jgi:hypothetical protein